MFPFEDLDWPKLLSYAAAEARTPYGKARLEELNFVENFASTIERAQELQTETQEVFAIVEKEAIWGPLRDLKEIHDELEILQKGAVLEVHALAKIRSWLYCFDSWNHFPKELAGKHFKNALTKIFDPYECVRVLDRVITPQG